MSETAYINGKVLVGKQFRDDLTIITHGGYISTVQAADGNIGSGIQIVDLAGDYLLPGLGENQ